MSKASADGDSAAAKAAKESGKLAARAHDEVNLVLVTGLMAMTAWCFIARDPFKDALHVRLEAVAAATAATPAIATDLTEKSPIFFWLPHPQDFPPPLDWVEPPVYWWLTVCSFLYVALDMAYLVCFPACTTRRAELLLHHAVTATLTVASLALRVGPLTALCMLVEVNTFLLTVKNLNRSPKVSLGVFRDGIRSLGSALYFAPISEPCFYLSWVLFRLLYYPFLLLAFHRFFDHPRAYSGAGYWVVIGSLAVLNALNQWWTFGGMGLAFTVGMGAVATAMLHFC